MGSLRWPAVTYVTWIDYIKLFLLSIHNFVNLKNLSQNILYISLCHLSINCRKMWTFIVSWIVKQLSHICLYQPKNSKYIYHTNMDLPLDRIFSITIKSSSHFLFTRRVICLYVTVMRNSLNLYINHTVMFILVTWNWSKMSLYVTSWKWELNLEKRHPVTKINWPIYTEMLLNSSQKSSSFN